MSVVYKGIVPLDFKQFSWLGIVDKNETIYFNNLSKAINVVSDIEVHSILYTKIKLPAYCDLNWLHTKIKTNFIYEPEVCLAFIWFFGDKIKTYFYATHFDVFIQDISIVDKYLEELACLFDGKPIFGF